MNELGRAVTALRLSCGLTVVLALSACDQKNETQSAAGDAPGTARNAAPASIPMGDNKSVTRFFIPSKGLRKRRRPRGSRGSRCALPSSGTSPRRGRPYVARLFEHGGDRHHARRERAGPKVGGCVQESFTLVRAQSWQHICIKLLLMPVRLRSMREPAWARRAVGEGVSSCRRAGRGRSTSRGSMSGM